MSFDFLSVFKHPIFKVFLLKSSKINLFSWLPTCSNTLSSIIITMVICHKVQNLLYNCILIILEDAGVSVFLMFPSLNANATDVCSKSECLLSQKSLLQTSQGIHELCYCTVTYLRVVQSECHCTAFCSEHSS